MSFSEQFLSIFIMIATLVALVLPAYLVRKTKIVGENAIDGVVALLLYIGQPFLTLKVFLVNPIEPTKEVLLSLLIALIVSVIAIIAVFFVAKLMFAKVGNREKAKIFTFCTVFSNCGFVGVPFLNMVSNNNKLAEMCLVSFIMAFSVLSWTLGVYIITGDKKQMSIKKAIFNPPTLPLIIALPMFLIPQINIFNMPITFGQYTMEPLAMITRYFADLTAPVSMVVVGFRMAEIPIKELFSGVMTYVTAISKLVVAPLVTILVAWIIKLIVGTMVTLSGFVYFAPIIAMGISPAALVVAFAQKFNSDSTEATRDFVVATLLSVITLPFVAMLATYIFL